MTFETPYNTLADDGAIVYINDALIGELGNYQIIASDIVIQGPKIANRLTVRKWEL